MPNEKLDVPTVHSTLGGYSHAVRAGKTLYISGQVGWNLERNLAGDGGFEAQARQTFMNLANVLQHAGADFSNIVKLTTLLTDRANVGTYRQVRNEFMQPPMPASTLAIVKGLVSEDLLIEIEAIAVLDD